MRVARSGGENPVPDSRTRAVEPGGDDGNPARPQAAGYGPGGREIIAGTQQGTLFIFEL